MAKNWRKKAVPDIVIETKVDFEYILSIFFLSLIVTWMRLELMNISGWGLMTPLSTTCFFFQLNKPRKINFHCNFFFSRKKQFLSRFLSYTFHDSSSIRHASTSIHVHTTLKNQQHLHSMQQNLTWTVQSLAVCEFVAKKECEKNKKKNICDHISRVEWKFPLNFVLVLFIFSEKSRDLMCSSFDKLCRTKPFLESDVEFYFF